MKAIRFLKLVMSLVFYFMVLGLLGSFITVTMLFIDTEIPFSINDTIIDKETLNIQLKLAAIVMLIAQFFITFAFYLLNKNFKSFSKYDFFSDPVITNFRKMGWLFIMANVIQFLSNFYIKSNDSLFMKRETAFEIYFSDNPFSLFVIGLLFISFSYVFRIARDFKQENTFLKEEIDLTI